MEHNEIVFATKAEAEAALKIANKAFVPDEEFSRPEPFVTPCNLKDDDENPGTLPCDEAPGCGWAVFSKDGEWVVSNTEPEWVFVA
jgi:hypothetical protein